MVRRLNETRRIIYGKLAIPLQIQIFVIKSVRLNVLRGKVFLAFVYCEILRKIDR